MPPPPPQPTHTHAYFSWHLFSARQPIKGEPRDVNQRRRNAKDITIYSCFPPHECLPLPRLFLLPVNPSVFWPGGGRGVLESWGFEIVLARGRRRRAAPVSSSLLGLWFPLTDPPASFHPSIQIIHRLPQPNVPYHLSTYIYMNVYPYIRTYS